MVLGAVSNTLRYDPERCINCGTCSIVCPHGVFRESHPVAELVDPEACMECGACQRNCPTGAIWVESGVGCAVALMRSVLFGEQPQEECCGVGGPTACCGGGNVREPTVRSESASWGCEDGPGSGLQEDEEAVSVSDSCGCGPASGCCCGG
ncbi:MAG: mercury methylation ferredoxin HgcB [Chloroflexia bacterium]